MTSIFSYKEIENLETFHIWKFYDKHFLTIRNHPGMKYDYFGIFFEEFLNFIIFLYQFIAFS